MNPLVKTGERILSVQGAYNVRDLGGYATKEGDTTNWGTFYRADGLHQLSDESRAHLTERGIASVIDLRHAKEVEEKQNVFADYAGVDYHNISLINPTSLANSQVRSLGDLYIGMLEGSQTELAQIFALLAESGDSAVLYHCTAGKDRTGVVSALLLALADVPQETIIEDYSLTADCLTPLMDELRRGRPDGIPAEMYEHFIGCDAGNMVMMLEHLTEKYANAEGYLCAIGLSEAQILALKGRLVG
ncbi:tyrosine-protein phosphatase [Paenibacillus hodogayensis]|uniref:Tyrosine-protein phosphatase n=1 Tax=Paenibacillus hodogayensis TaxID=279208 RepID=A0ABV5W816_9BACL